VYNEDLSRLTKSVRALQSPQIRESDSLVTLADDDSGGISVQNLEVHESDIGLPPKSNLEATSNQDNDGATCFSRDSGYYSQKSHIPFKKREGQEEPGQDDWETGSIASLASNSSTSKNIKGVAEEFAELLVNDMELRQSIIKALESLGSHMFENIFRRLLGRYASDLRGQVQTSNQQRAMRAIYMYRAHTTSIIFKEFTTTGQEKHQAMEQLIFQQPGTRIQLEKFLSQTGQERHTSISGQGDTHSFNVEIGELGDDDFGESDQPDLPNLESVKEFLISCPAFQDLKKNIYNLAHPTAELAPFVAAPVTAEEASQTPNLQAEKIARRERTICKPETKRRQPKAVSVQRLKFKSKQVGNMLGRQSSWHLFSGQDWQQ
jgi:hypothetical protein